MRTILTLTLALLLTGCAGISYVANNYSGPKTARVETYNKNFDIWDVPEQRKMLISATLGSAIGVGVTSGLTFGAASSQQPERIYRMAGEEYLKTTYKQSCEIEQIEFVVKPQYEAFYMCDGDDAKKVKAAREQNFAEIEPAANNTYNHRD